MADGQIKVLAFSEASGDASAIRSRCSEAGLELQIINQQLSLGALSKTLEKQSQECILLIITDLQRVLLSAELVEIRKRVLPQQVVFGAASYFNYQSVHLRYFYWKHYPRPDRYYN